jgi:hypothetical protein
MQDSPDVRERLMWAVCPILRAADECDMPQILNGPRPECRKCPPVESRGGVAGCRMIAALVADAARSAFTLSDHIAAVEAAGTHKVVPVEPGNAKVDTMVRADFLRWTVDVPAEPTAEHIEACAKAIWEDELPEDLPSWDDMLATGEATPETYRQEAATAIRTYLALAARPRDVR